MEDYDKTFKAICRVCLKYDKEENMFSLTYNSSENSLSKCGMMFEKVTKIPVKKNDYLPTNICHKCKKSLLEVSTFLTKCEMSDRKLSKLIYFGKNQHLNGEMLKEFVYQYTLFCHYFPEKSASMSRDSSPSIDDETTNVIFQESKPEIKRLIEVKVEIEPVIKPEDYSHSAQESLENNSRNESSQSNCDNIDILLDSIEKLVCTKSKPNLRQQRKKNIKPKKAVCNLTCNICLKTLANPATYKYHMERHRVCRYICDQCGKGFPVLAYLTQHQIYKHGIGPSLECNHCSFKAGKKFELIEHIRIHTGERPFTCEKCGLNFRRKAIYINHLKYHSEKTVSCDYCPKKFFIRGEMLTHCNNVHDRMYMFICKICNITYASRKSVRKHMFIKHGISREMQGKIARTYKNVTANIIRENKPGEQTVL